jgi:hypothetical protein
VSGRKKEKKFFLNIDIRVEMVSTMKNVTMSSSTFLSSAKTVAVDPSAPQAKNNLANAARYLVTYCQNVKHCPN